MIKKDGKTIVSCLPEHSEEVMSRSRNFEKSRKALDERLERERLERLKAEADLSQMEEVDLLVEPDLEEDVFMRSYLNWFEGSSRFMVEFCEGVAHIVPLSHA